MDRRMFFSAISYLNLIAAGCVGDGDKRGGGETVKVTATDIERIIDQRLAERSVDYAAVLEQRPHIIERQPDLAETLRAMVNEHPEIVKVLDDFRFKGLKRLRAADVDPAVKKLLLDFQLEKILHEVATCMDHFLGVFEILRSWGHRDAVAYVGLFHAVYGTEFNPIQVMDHTLAADRDRLRKIVGTESERWIYLYAIIDSTDFIAQFQATNKPTGSAKDFEPPHQMTPLDEEDWQAIAESQVANSYEPYLALDQDPSTLSRLDRFEPLRPSLSAGAVQALDLSADSEQG